MLGSLDTLESILYQCFILANSYQLAQDFFHPQYLHAFTSGRSPRSPASIAFHQNHIPSTRNRMNMGL